MIIIPFTEYPSVSKEIVIDDISYIFSFVWNTRMEAWTLSIYTIENEPILVGIKLVLNYELIRMYRHLDIPQGEMYVIDITDNETKIAYDDFTSSGRNLILAYYEEGEFESI
jgi:hypothetical protein